MLCTTLSAHKKWWYPVAAFIVTFLGLLANGNRKIYIKKKILHHISRKLKSRTMCNCVRIMRVCTSTSYI